jgi:rubredoxin
MSLVRHNLMTRQGYSPYCGGERCRTMPRTRFDGEQFVCPTCGWRSSFEPEFIAAYKAHWVNVMAATKEASINNPHMR